MSVTASWAHRNRLEIAWFLFAAANVLVTLRMPEFETVPFHFVWVSFSLLYGYRVYRLGTTLVALAVIIAATGATLGRAVADGPQGLDELTEVPLMAAMFLAMVWSARRRQAALEQVRASAERERQFLADASHLLKTPITVARAHAELALASPVPATTRADLDVLVEELVRLSKLARGLCELASAEQRGSIVPVVAIDLQDLALDTARRWRPSACRAWSIDVSAQGALHADRAQVDSALDALIENAVEGTGDGDRIAVALSAEGETAIIEVSDSGVGIPAQFLPRVFERFSSSRTAVDGRRGSGLGLAIVKAIADAHGGSVSVRSAVGVGTTASLRLPGFHAAREPEAPWELGDDDLRGVASV